jgi:hypothetical protein
MAFWLKGYPSEVSKKGVKCRPGRDITEAKLGVIVALFLPDMLSIACYGSNTFTI